MSSLPSQVDSLAVVSFLEAAGSRVRQLWLTYSSSMNAIMAVLSVNCPEAFGGSGLLHEGLRAAVLLNGVWGV